MGMSGSSIQGIVVGIGEGVGVAVGKSVFFTDFCLYSLIFSGRLVFPLSILSSDFPQLTQTIIRFMRNSIKTFFIQPSTLHF